MALQKLFDIFQDLNTRNTSIIHLVFLDDFTHILMIGAKVNMFMLCAHIYCIPSNRLGMYMVKMLFP